MLSLVILPLCTITVDLKSIDQNMIEVQIFSFDLRDLIKVLHFRDYSHFYIKSSSLRGSKAIGKTFFKPMDRSFSDFIGQDPFAL